MHFSVLHLAVDRTDPATQHATTKAHLLDVFSRYGPAVFMLNLIRLVQYAALLSYLYFQYFDLIFLYLFETCDQQNQAQETPLGLEFSKCVGMMRHVLNAEASAWWNVEGKRVCHNILRLMDDDEKKQLQNPASRVSVLSTFKQCQSCLSGVDPEFACHCVLPSSWARVGSLEATPKDTVPLLGRKRSTVIRVSQIKVRKLLPAENMGTVLDYCYRWYALFETLFLQDSLLVSVGILSSCFCVGALFFFYFFPVLVCPRGPCRL